MEAPPMARPSPAALDVMEHIADAVDDWTCSCRTPTA
jgi:hypothetical protein